MPFCPRFSHTKLAVDLIFRTFKIHTYEIRATESIWNIFEAVLECDVKTCCQIQAFSGTFCGMFPENCFKYIADALRSSDPNYVDLKHSKYQMHAQFGMPGPWTKRHCFRVLCIGIISHNILYWICQICYIFCSLFWKSKYIYYQDQNGWINWFESIASRPNFFDQKFLMTTALIAFRRSPWTQKTFQYD